VVEISVVWVLQRSVEEEGEIGRRAGGRTAGRKWIGISLVLRTLTPSRNSGMCMNPSAQFNKTLIIISYSFKACLL
jgi:hypothetical protein